MVVTPHYEGQPGLMKGLLTLAMLVGLWIVVVLLFWRQWRIIRQLEPTPSTRILRVVNESTDDVDTSGRGGITLYEPHNIGSIRVVKKVKDSVIVGGSPKRSPLKPAWSDIEEGDEDVESDDDMRTRANSDPVKQAWSDIDEDKGHVESKDDAGGRKSI